MSDSCVLAVEGIMAGSQVPDAPGRGDQGFVYLEVDGGSLMWES